MDYLAAHWLALLLAGIGLILGGLSLLRRPQAFWTSPSFVVAAALLLLGGGDFGVSVTYGLLGDVWPWREIALWVAAGALVALFVKLIVVVTTGEWLAPLAWIFAAVLLLGLGGAVLPETSNGLTEAGKFLVSLEPLQPIWLLLLLLVPVIIAFSFRSLAGLGPVRRWVAIGLRCLLVVLLTLALAETHARQPNDNVTVLFLWDRSLSIPHEFEQGRDVYDERMKRFINEAVERRGQGREEDRAGVIVFGKYPRLELPPSKVPQLKFNRIASTLDETYTDIASAIKLALASFPEGTGKRIVL